MNAQIFPKSKPPIMVSSIEHRRLMGLAHVTRRTAPEVADELEAEMDRAEVVGPGLIPPHIVQMGSTVLFHTEDMQKRTVTLVYPLDADIAAGRISVLTPIGAALIGMGAGYTIGFTGNDGREHTLTVVEVTQPTEAYMPG